MILDWWIPFKLYVIHVYKQWASTLWDIPSCLIVVKKLHYLHCALLIYRCDLIFNLLVSCLLASWCMCLDLWLFMNSHILTNLCLLTHFALEFETITLFASKFLVLFLVQSYVMECTTHIATFFCCDGIVAKFYWHDKLIFTNKICQDLYIYILNFKNIILVSSYC